MFSKKPVYQARTKLERSETKTAMNETVKLTIRAPKEGDHPYLESDGQRERPVHLTLDTATGIAQIEVDYEAETRSVPVDVWEGRTKRWTVPGGWSSGDYADLLESVKPYLEAHLAPETKVVGEVGDADEGGQDRDLIADMIDEMERNAGSGFGHIDLEDWLGVDSSLDQQCEEKITAETTDEGIDNIIAEWEDLAKADNVILDGAEVVRVKMMNYRNSLVDETV